MYTKGVFLSDLVEVDAVYRQVSNLFYPLRHILPILNKSICTSNMRQAQPVWRTKSYNFKREAWEGNALFFFQVHVLFKVFILIIWLELSLFDLWLFRSFYLRRSSAENLVEKYFLIKFYFKFISILYRVNN